MSLDKAYNVDTKKAENGIEVEFVEAMNEDGTIPTFLLAYAGGPNSEYKAALAKRTKGFRSNIGEDVARRILHHVYAEAIIKNWSNVQINGEELPYSKENCLKLLKEFPEFFTAVKERAEDMTAYLREQAENTAKN